MLDVVLRYLPGLSHSVCFDELCNCFSCCFVIVVNVAFFPLLLLVLF